MLSLLCWNSFLLFTRLFFAGFHCTRIFRLFPTSYTASKRRKRSSARKHCTSISRYPMLHSCILFKVADRYRVQITEDKKFILRNRLAISLHASSVVDFSDEARSSREAGRLNVFAQATWGRGRRHSAAPPAFRLQNLEFLFSTLFYYHVLFSLYPQHLVNLELLAKPHKCR